MSPVNPQDLMLSKLNPLTIYRKARKSSPPPPSSKETHATLNPWIPKLWKRTSSDLPEEGNNHTVVSRSQVKKTPKITSSHAMAVSSPPKLRLHQASLESGAQPFDAGNGDTLSPDYFVGVNLKFTNTNTTSVTSQYSRDSIHVE